MATTKTSNNVNVALASLALAGPELHVQRVIPINSKFARVVGTIAATASPDQLLAAVRKVSNKLTPAVGSFAAIASNGVTTSVEGIVGVIEERIVLSDENRANFESLSSNMYMDNEERLWSLKKTDAGDILIKSHAGDDMEVMTALQACVASTSVGYQEAEPAANQMATARSQIVGGDLVAFISESGNLNMAFVVSDVRGEDGADKGLMTVDRQHNIEHINRHMVVASVNGSQIEMDDTAEMEAVAAGNFSMEFIADYYRKVFLRSPEYFEKFWARFKSHNFA